jgi:hypothetical protein
MRTTLLSAFMLLFASQLCYAQSFTIKGSLSDTVNNMPLQHAAVTLIRAKDSVMETFVRTKADGSFTAKVNSPGKYLVMATFPSFVDYIDVVELRDKKAIDMGKLPMVSKMHLLKEVVATSQYAAIKVKGDTIEYMADSFKVKEGDNVEALLKKLPGIQVDRTGKITAQGEQVQKLLVDGEEFFSDDPAVVSKSLQADAVERVQVFDKKSEQAEFTGVDDGERTKTINLQLKEDKKKGYFGKTTAAGGAGDVNTFWENQGMISAFKGKRKAAAFGIMSNTGKIGLGWEDRDKFGGGGGNTTMVEEDGGIIQYFGGGEDDNFESWNGNYNGQGLPKAWTGGAHFSNKWKEDKYHVSGNYRYAKQDIATLGNTLTEYNLPGDEKRYNRQSRNLFSTGQRHRLDGLYEWKIDSMSTLKLTANGNFSETQSNSVYSTELLNAAGALTNRTNRSVNSDAMSKSLNATLDWRRKFNKKGRTISLNVTERYRESESDGFLKATSTAAAADNFDQHKENDSKALGLSTRAVYTEPLAKKLSLELNYSYGINNNSAKRSAFNKTNPLSDVYDSLDTRFSSNYDYEIYTHTGGSSLRFNYEKIKFGFGGSVSNAAYNQHDVTLDTMFRYNFTNFFPRANFSYEMSKQRKFNIGYSGWTKQPTLDQIQPLRDNTDPLNIAIGNPNLTQEFNQNINFRYNNYKAISGKYTWINCNVTFMDNAISRTENIDGLGRRTYQYINVDGNYSAWGYFGYGMQLKKLDTRAGVWSNIGLTHINNFVNGFKNSSDNHRYSVGMSFDYEGFDEKLEIGFNPGVTYNDNNSTIATLSQSYWTSENRLEAECTLIPKFEFGTELTWNLRQKTAIFTANNNVLQWDAYVARKFAKNDQLELRLSVFDILNQNIGYTRTAAANAITEDNYNRIRRYGLLSLTWNFTKTPAGAPADNNGGGNKIIIKR